MVLALVFLASVITYLDRVCISVAAPEMSKELRLSRIQMGYVFGAFGLAYALFEIPAAWLGDRWGQRRTMVRIVAGWSVFTMLTGLVSGYRSLLITRFAFGAAEAGAFPTLSRALSNWFPAEARSRANGVMWMGARLGGAFAPPLAVVLIASFGWRNAFAIFGCAGLMWCVAFARLFRDDPGEHVGVSPAELSHIRSSSFRAPSPDRARRVPWRRLLLSRNMLALFWMYFASGFGFQFFVTWLPTYLIREHGLTLQRSGVYASLPMAAGAVGCLAGGALSDWLVLRTGSLIWGRRAVGVSGFLFGAAGFAIATLARSPEAAIACLVIAAGAHDLTVPVAWATCVDAGGRFGGTAAGFMNMASSLSGMVAPVSAAWLSEQFGSFHAVFGVAAAIYVVGGLLWFVIRPEEAPAS
jgi:MFS family permease